MSDFFTLEFFVQVLTACLGTLGFAVLFKVQVRHLPFASACGILTYGLYYTVAFFGGSLFVAAFVASAAATLFSECCARLRRAPALVFLVPGAIPIVPGGDLYYTMRYLLSGDFSSCADYLVRALLIGIGIAGGIVTVSVVASLFSGNRKAAKQEK